MGYGQLYLIGIVFIISSFAVTTVEWNNKGFGIADPYNVSIANTELNNLSSCRHEEQFKDGIYCDAYYVVSKVYGSGSPGDFQVTISERGFCPYIEWQDQNSSAECYSSEGNYGAVIVYLNYKSLFTYPGGSVEVYSYNETDIYQTTCCGYNY